MELEQRLQRFIDGDGTHDDILGALVPLLHQKSDLEHMFDIDRRMVCLLYTSPSPRDRTRSRMPSSA